MHILFIVQILNDICINLHLITILQIFEQQEQLNKYLASLRDECRNQTMALFILKKPVIKIIDKN